MTVVPQPTPDTAHYWEGMKVGELRIQFCHACQRHFFYARPFCKYCTSRDVAWVVASGKARLVSYIINHREIPGMQGFSPVIALVELEEGVRMMSNLVDIEADPESISLDMPLSVRFVSRGESVLPVFTADEGAA